jgi:large subunit ribosomal protein L19
MTNKIIQALEAEQLKANVTEFSPGDTVVVQVQVKEGDRVRSQVFVVVV